MSHATVDWFGDRAVVVRPDDPQSRQALLVALRQQGHEVRAGMDGVLVVVDEPDEGLRDRVARWLASVEVRPGSPRTSVPTVEIPVSYDGADLAVAAEALGCTVDALIGAHTRQEWTVAMMGFAPGFGYLVPVGDVLVPWGEVARLDRPRSRVPGGSVAVAAGMSAVYPGPMPGGWLLLGTTEVTLFDPSDDAQPTLLRPGHRVRFVETAR